MCWLRPSFVLRSDAEAARKAIEDQVTERVRADAEGAQLLQQRDALNAKMAERRGRGAGL